MSSVGAMIPRGGLAWLLVAQLLVILPHLEHLPLWVSGLWFVCAVWRVQIFRMRAPYPRASLKILLMLACGFGVFLSRGSLVGLDAGVVLLIAAFALKLVEMRTRRDALVVIFLGFFAVLTAYLFEDGLLAALYSLLPVTALLAALIGLQHSGPLARPKFDLRLAASLLLQALPLMALLFVFFPRFDPLWTLPAPRERGVTGLADSMTPGDMARLGRSAALVFRATFDGPLPASAQLYWRALTLDHFDGRRWSQAQESALSATPDWQKLGAPLSYSVVMQPSARPWLYTLDVPEITLEGVRLMEDFRLQRRHPVNQSLLYRVTSWPAALREPEGSIPALRRALQLPQSGNPRSRAWAAELRRLHPEPESLVRVLLEHFRREPYRYTLKPPPLGRDGVDDFLFERRAGFCAHFAGATTFVLRAAGIPARVVAGYQGGEVNPAGNYLIVHQFDAHAWVEYWRPQRGWIRIDPTFQVAPQRIEQGPERAVAEERSFLEQLPLSLIRYRDIGWVNRLRLEWDSLNYGWQRWILGYQSEQQLRMMRYWFAGLDLRLVGGAVVLCAAGLFGMLGLLLFWPWRRHVDPLGRQFLRFEGLMARQGLIRSPGEGPRAFAERAARRLPDQAGPILDFLALFEAQRYGGRRHVPGELAAALHRLRRALPWRLWRNPS